MEVIDIEAWNRKQLFEHFSSLKDPYFGVTVPLDVTKAYKRSKALNYSFFGTYLHDCMSAINDIEELKLRIDNNKVIKYNTINASATIMRADKTFGFSFINYDKDLSVFLNNLEEEKHRIQNSKELFPPKNGLDCIHCSAMPWLNFTGHKEPVSGVLDSVPKLAFSKMIDNSNSLKINVAINVNHALVDGYHLSLFVDRFQHYLDQ